MVVRLILGLIVSLVPGCSRPSLSRLEGQNSLPAGIYAIQTQLGSNNNDLLPLGEVIAESKYVGLGESFHTSGGFIALRFKVVKYLIEEKGFRTLAFELPRSSGKKVQEFLAGKGTSLNEATQSLGLWASEEAKAMMGWLKRYNEINPKDPVMVFGLDGQQAELDKETMHAFILTNAPHSLSERMAEIARCDFAGDSSYPFSSFSACTQGLENLEKFVLSQPNNEEALLATWSLLAWQGQVFYFKSDPEKSWQSRDSGMARTFRYLMRRPSKAILWAHNVHLMQQSTKIKKAGSHGAQSLGTLLREEYGLDYFPIGTMGYEVETVWPGQGVRIEPLPQSDSLESNLEKLGSPNLFVDLSIKNSVVKRNSWYRTSPNIEMIPSDQFRALLFMDKSAAMTPLTSR